MSLEQQVWSMTENQWTPGLLGFQYPIACIQLESEGTNYFVVGDDKHARVLSRFLNKLGIGWEIDEEKQEPIVKPSKDYTREIIEDLNPPFSSGGNYQLVGASNFRLENSLHILGGESKTYGLGFNEDHLRKIPGITDIRPQENNTLSFRYQPITFSSS